MSAIAITTVAVADEEADVTTDETTVAAAADTGTIDIATTVEETEVADTEGGTAVVRWTIEVTVEAIVIITTVGEEATDTMIVDVAAEMTFAEDAIDHPIGEGLQDAAGTTDVAVALEADHHPVVEITAETTEEVEVTLEVLLEAAMTIAREVAMRITEVVAVTTTVSAVALPRCTAETIAEGTIAVIAAR